MLVGDRVLDLGLNVLDTEATHLWINTAEATTYSNATSGGTALGSKNFGAGAVFGSPAAGSPNGRKVASAAITDGTISTGGTATHFAIVDSANSRLLLAGPLSASQVVTAGNPFSLPSFDFRIPGA